MLSKRFIFFTVLFTLLTGQVFSESLHPDVKLLDQNGNPVISSDLPVSTIKTCGTCHDAEYIASNSYHSTVGFDKNADDETIDPGFFNNWDPVIYHRMMNDELKNGNLGLANWVMTYGKRHVGGGPAEFNQSMKKLNAPNAQSSNTESHWLNPETKTIEPWNWQNSGIVEMNCFLCHTPNPDNQARMDALEQGHFKWANTATLTGIAIKNGDHYRYNTNSINPDGTVKRSVFQVTDPSNENCGLCHGLVKDDESHPVVLTECTPENWSTMTTGQIFSPQRISDSGLNLENKSELAYAWDVHAERLVNCVDCHFSINNPIYYQESALTRPAHLNFDARRMDIDDYLLRPSHDFAFGPGNHNPESNTFSNNMRRCESCHNIEATHDWLPYKERHMQTMTCESCHIPHIRSTAKQTVDWTMIHPDGTPRTECRGTDASAPNSNTLLKGYQPVLLGRIEPDGSSRLAPYNLITSWFWVQGEKEAPVLLSDLKKTLLNGNDFDPQVVKYLDANQNGSLEDSEMVLNSAEKIDFIKSRLSSIGLINVAIKGEVNPYGLHHNVTHGDWTTRTCESCHSNKSKISQPMVLASSFPPVVPQMINRGSIIPKGKVITKNKVLVFKPAPDRNGYYILGHDKSLVAQIIGALIFISVIIGITIHATLRVIATAKHKHEKGPFKSIYMYTVYERFWHWMQAIAIIGLIFTGLTIHSPLIFKFMPFHVAVIIHNVLGFILLGNAFLAAFYHFSSGKIKNYLPEPKGFFSQAIDQTLFYIKGIFKGQPHPFEKDVDKKLNPLQKITYLIILNALLPIQIITGILIWGAQRWPALAESLGGLLILVPIHSLVAWFFAAFLMLHIYLTTTGYTATSAIQAMIIGWEKVHTNHNGD